MPTKFWLQYINGRDDSEDTGVDERIILERILEIEGRKAWAGFIRLRIGTGGGIL
jgi:hypothetical protein